MIIKKAGITDHIQTVLNGKEAIDFITNKGKFEKDDDVYPQPMLTLLDINMPVMDGWMGISGGLPPIRRLPKRKNNYRNVNHFAQS